MPGVLRVSGGEKRCETQEKRKQNRATSKYASFSQEMGINQGLHDGPRDLNSVLH